MNNYDLFANIYFQCLQNPPPNISELRYLNTKLYKSSNILILPMFSHEDPDIPLHLMCYNHITPDIPLHLMCYNHITYLLLLIVLKTVFVN